MGHLDFNYPTGLSGDESLTIAVVSGGPTGFVQGRGADMVPSAVTPTEVRVVGDDFVGAKLSFPGVNEAGKDAVLAVTRDLLADGREVTERDVLAVLNTRFA